MQKDLSMDALRGRKTTPEGDTEATYYVEESKADREWPERLQHFAECMQWLEGKRREFYIHPESRDFAEVMEAMAEHRDYLNEQWHDGSTEEFKESLRRYMRACVGELRRRAA